MILSIQALVLAVLVVVAYLGMFVLGWWCRGNADQHDERREHQHRLEALGRASETEARV